LHFACSSCFAESIFAKAKPNSQNSGVALSLGEIIQIALVMLYHYYFNTILRRILSTNAFLIEIYLLETIEQITLVLVAFLAILTSINTVKAFIKGN